MTTNSLDIKKNNYFPTKLNKALALLDQSEVIHPTVENIPTFWENVKLSFMNLASFFITPCVLGTKAIVNLIRAICYGIAFPISCLATGLTLGLSKEGRAFTKKSLFKTFQHGGEAFLDLMTLIFAEIIYFIGIFFYPRLPYLMQKKEG